MTYRQLKNNKLIHLLNIKDLSKEHIMHILDLANNEIINDNLAKSNELNNISIANLFFEPSTRTRNTFEIAAKRLSAQIINIDIVNSATKKNESILDTMQTLKAMQINMFIIRHGQNNMANFLAKNIKGVSIINAGTGTEEHPTQALLDCLTIYQNKKKFAELTITIVGDIINSRVAHSDIYAFTTLGVKNIRLVAPKNLIYKAKNCINYENIDEAIIDADVIIILRLQKERMLAADIPNEQEYFKNYGMTTKRLKLAKIDAILMHPGPINREVEIESKVADGKQSVILKQVTNGIAVRMAVMKILTQNNEY